MATSQSRLAELANAVAVHTQRIDSYLCEKALPHSFAADSPVDLSLPPELKQSRLAVLEASQELNDLLRGPKDLLFNHHVCVYPRGFGTACFSEANQGHSITSWFLSSSSRNSTLPTRFLPTAKYRLGTWRPRLVSVAPPSPVSSAWASPTECLTSPVPALLRTLQYPN